jgi:hypothetical protein
MVQNKVVLEVIGEGPFIKAPIFCPYKILDEGIQRVNSSTCSLCKYCNFIPQITASGGEILSVEEVVDILSYIEKKSVRIVKSIIAQIQYLHQRDRAPLAIFINIGVFEQALIYANISFSRKQNLINYYAGEHICLGVSFGLPVYIFGKLVNSPVMVVGEISWK